MLALPLCVSRIHLANRLNDQQSIMMQGLETSGQLEGRDLDSVRFSSTVWTSYPQDCVVTFVMFALPSLS